MDMYGYHSLWKWKPFYPRPAALKHPASVLKIQPVHPETALRYEPEKEKLSKIIEEINQTTGSNFDKDVAVKSMLQIRDLMMKSNNLRISAKNNNEHDFELSYFDHIDDMLIEGLEHNKDFFTLLLNNNDIKKEVLGTFAEEIYKSLRESEVN